MANHGVLRHGRRRRPPGVTPDPATDELLVDDHGWMALDRLMEAETVNASLRTPQRRPRVSAWAAAGLITGVVALAATLTGLLAPLGFALGLVCLVICAGGLVATHRPDVTGHSLALIGLISALAAVVLAVLAMSGESTWPNSGTDEIAQLHTWLNDRWPWLERW